MSKLSRRDAMKRGGQALAAGAALSILPSINTAQAQEDAELFALYDEYSRASKIYTTASGRADTATFALRKAFRPVPTLRTVWDALNTPGSPERVALIDAPGTFSKAIECVESVAKEKWLGDFAEAEGRAGIPALRKKEDATRDTWLELMDRFYKMPAHTPAGMILKITNEWTDCDRREWRAKGLGADVEYHSGAMASVLLDIERLAGAPI